MGVMPGFLGSSGGTAAPTPPNPQPSRFLVEKHGLQDSDPMPFGKYKGAPMQDVPADYLHWLWTNEKEHDKFCPVADYIRRNIDPLQKEHPDGIW